MHVSAITFVYMILTMLISFALPIVGFIIFRKKKADILPFFIGCAIMLVFALVIESIFHQIILLKLPVGTTIMNNILLYALYGGMMAGLFEETGRLVAFSVLMKKYRGTDQNALMYGAGHGGFEAAVLMGLTSISNLFIAALINANTVGLVTAAMPAEASEAFMEQIKPLYEGPAYIFLLGGVERIIAFVLQICLSVFVWFAVKHRKKYLYVIAILVHALVDGVTVIVNQYTSVIVTETILALMTAIFVVITIQLWKQNQSLESTENTGVSETC